MRTMLSIVFTCGNPVSDEDARQYVRDDVLRGITSVRCFLASRREGFSESTEQWKAWHFDENTLDRLRLENLQSADRRLRMLLDEYPDVAVQLILFPLEAYARDDRFWTALTPAQRDRLLRNLVARFAAFPQLFWLITNDAHYGDKFPNSNAMAREALRCALTATGLQKISRTRVSASLERISRNVFPRTD